MFSTLLFDHVAVTVTRTTLKTNAIIGKFQENISAQLQNKNQKQFVTHLYGIKKLQCKLEVKENKLC